MDSRDEHHEPVDVIERARRYVAKMEPAISGAGGHNATFAVACVLIRGFSLPEKDAWILMEEYNGRCKPQWSEREIAHKLKQAAMVSDKPDGYLLGSASAPHGNTSGVASEPKASVKPRPEINRAAIVEHIRGVPEISYEWLRKRSPVDVTGLSSGDFLNNLFNPDERVLIFTSQHSQGDFIWWCGHGGYRLSQQRSVKAVPSNLPTGAADGIWYLVQPVTGQWNIAAKVKWEDGSRNVDGKWTRRSQQNVTAWRYYVLESDVLSQNEWLKVLAALALPIVAIYTSGKRSIHALLRLDVPAKAAWDSVRDHLRAVLCPLGADPAALSAVRLSRLPGCKRNGQLQRLLWLSPGAPESQRIMCMHEVRS